MRLPRDLSGEDLARALGRIGYTVTRQSGSHMRLTLTGPRQHHVSVPHHDALRLGTLAGILDDVSAHLRISREDLVDRLFG